MLRRLCLTMAAMATLSACGSPAPGLMASVPMAMSPAPAGDVTSYKHGDDGRMLRAAIMKAFPGTKKVTIVSWKRTGFLGMGDWLRFEVDADGRKITGQLNTYRNILQLDK